jgi:hypothetical protein
VPAIAGHVGNRDAIDRSRRGDTSSDVFDNAHVVMYEGRCTEEETCSQGESSASSPR